MSTGYINGYPTSGYASEAQLRTEFKKLKDALDDTISRTNSGSGSNAMEEDLDIGGNDIINVRNIQAENIIFNGEDLEDIISSLEATDQKATQALNTSIEALSEAQEASSVASTASDQAFDALSNSLSTSLRVDLYENKVNNYSNLVDSLESQVVSLGGRTSAVETVADNATYQSGVNSLRISALETEIPPIKDRLDILEPVVEQHGEDIVELQSTTAKVPNIIAHFFASFANTRLADITFPWDLGGLNITDAYFHNEFIPNLRVDLALGTRHQDNGEIL